MLTIEFPKSKRNTRRLCASIGVAVALFVSAFLVPSCSRNSEPGESDTSPQASSKSPSQSESNKGETKKAAKKKREKAVSVKASRAIRSILVIPVIAEGTVRARHSADIKVEVEGRLQGVYVDEGQKVSKGRIIARIDAREYEVAMEEARSKYLQALSLLAIEEDSLEIKTPPPSLKKKMDELDKLEKKGLISSEERMLREIALDVQALRDGFFRVDVAAARSGVSAARTAFERAKIDLEHTRIRAPFSGTITGLNLSAGEQVVKGQTLCRIVNNESVEAEVGVLEADMNNLEIGDPAMLVFPSLDDTLRVRVDVISPEFDRNSRTCRVLMRFKSKGKVRPGMFVRALIAGKTFKDRLLVPKEAILTRDGRPLLFKVDNDKAKWLYIKPGESNDYLVEVERVLQGGSLSPGDLVVVSDHLTLSHDAKIKIKKIIPTLDPWHSYYEDD